MTIRTYRLAQARKQYEKVFGSMETHFKRNKGGVLVSTAISLLSHVDSHVDSHVEPKTFSYCFLA